MTWFCETEQKIDGGGEDQKLTRSWIEWKIEKNNPRESKKIMEMPQSDLAAEYQEENMWYQMVSFISYYF